MVSSSARRQRNNSRKQDKPENFAQSCALLSVNGTLQSLIKTPGEESIRSQGYNAIAIGKPLTIRYLHCFLKLDVKDSDEQEIMLSSFVKTEEEKKAAAESVNFYDPKLLFKDGKRHLDTFSADVYGHELIYYSKSYLGEPIKLTTRIMEIDNHESLDAISDGISQASDIPFFLEYVPFLAVAKGSFDLFKSILKMLDKDDPIVKGLRMALHFQEPHMPRLQSGRIVCIQGMSEEKALSLGLRLSVNNKLLDADGKLYENSPYYVIQVNAAAHKGYENFQYHQQTAELLSLTNRDGGFQEFVNVMAQGIKVHGDMEVIDEMEELRDSLDEPASVEKFKALFKGLSKDVKSVYRKKYNEILDE